MGIIYELSPAVALVCITHGVNNFFSELFHVRNE